MSDVSSATPQPVISVEMQNTIRRLYSQARDLRVEVNRLKRQQVTNMETMRDIFLDTCRQLRVSNITEVSVQVNVVMIEPCI